MGANTSSLRRRRSSASTLAAVTSDKSSKPSRPPPAGLPAPPRHPHAGSEPCGPAAAAPKRSTASTSSSADSQLFDSTASKASISSKRTSSVIETEPTARELLARTIARQLETVDAEAEAPHPALRVVRLYVSCPDRGFTEERKALPDIELRLNQMFRRQHLRFVFMDVRWGAGEGPDALSFRLDRIRACRPWFIALVGCESGPAAARRRHEPWEDGAWLDGWPQDASVQELEAEFGVLGAAAADAPRLRSFAFLRSGRCDARTQLLRERLVCCSSVRCHRYEAAGQLREAAMRTIRDAAAALAPAPPAGPTREPGRAGAGEEGEEEERAGWEAELHCASFVGRHGLRERLAVFLAGRRPARAPYAAAEAPEGPPCLLLTGPPGSGKSALVCRVARDAAAAGTPVALVLAGAGPSRAPAPAWAGEAGGVLRRALEAAHGALERGRAPLALALDGVEAALSGPEQAARFAEGLLQLAEAVSPPPPRLLLACRPDCPGLPTLLAALRPQRLELPPLSPLEADALLGDLLLDRGRRLPPPLAAALLARPAAALPAYLRAAADRLAACGTQEEAARAVAALAEEPPPPCPPPAPTAELPLADGPPAAALPPPRSSDRPPVPPRPDRPLPALPPSKRPLPDPPSPGEQSAPPPPGTAPPSPRGQGTQDRPGR